jgi:hypothetical protein
MKFKLIFFWLFAVQFSVIAQSFTITGRVIDNDTEEGIPFCNVYIAGETIGTTTDFDGLYTFKLDKYFENITVSALGYELISKPMLNQAEQTMNFRLMSASLQLEEVVIYAGENPANEIIRNIIANKEANRLENYENYYCQDYTKVEMDFDNINEGLVDNKWMSDFKVIYDYVDSVSDEKPFLPIFIKETIANTYGKKGEVRQELEAVRESGIGNSSVLKYLDRMHQPYNIYDNRINVLEKPLVSPFANSGLFYYEYYIEDSTFIQGKWCYNLRFKPKRKQENTFYGDFWVADSSFAIVKLNMWMSKDVNINFINRVIIFEEYTLESNNWTLGKQKMVMDFTATKEAPGLIGRKTSSFKNYTFNQPEFTEKYKKADTQNYDLTLLEKEKSYWEVTRHDSLSQNEAEIYEMIDTIQDLPMYQRYYKIAETIGSGYLTVYKGKNGFGPLRIGPYPMMYYQNVVEGNRFSLGASADFLDRTMRLEGQIGYGTKDNDFKYFIQYRWKLKDQPRIMFGIAYLDDIILTHKSSEDLVANNLFSNSFRRDLPLRMVRARETKIWAEKFWNKGMHVRPILMNRQLDPYGGVEENSLGFEYKFINPTTNQIDTTVNTTEIVVRLRYAFNEKRINGNFDYLVMGSSKLPIVELIFTQGIKGILGSQHNYQKVQLNYSHWIYTNPVGWFRYQIQVGKVFSDEALPMLLLEIPQGNDTYFYGGYSYNVMNRYEFVTDQFVNVQLEHHFDGFFLNKIPLIRKLDWRSLATFKGSWGTISDENMAANALNTSDVGGTIPLRSLSTIPYMEAGVGIENILKVFQIHAIWRLNYLDNPEASRFMLQGGFSFSF